MSRPLIAASAFALALGLLTSPALAQTGAEAPAAAESATLTEAEFEVLAEAFGERMKAMETEMQAAVAEAAGDAGKQAASLDVIQARYQSDADGFASALETFLNQQAEEAAGADEGGDAVRAQVAGALAVALPQIRSIPQQVRAKAEQAAAAAAPAS